MIRIGKEAKVNSSIHQQARTLKEVDNSSTQQPAAS